VRAQEIGALDADRLAVLRTLDREEERRAGVGHDELVDRDRGRVDRLVQRRDRTRDALASAEVWELVIDEVVGDHDRDARVIGRVSKELDVLLDHLLRCHPATRPERSLHGGQEVANDLLRLRPSRDQVAERFGAGQRVIDHGLVLPEAEALYVIAVVGHLFRRSERVVEELGLPPQPADRIAPVVHVSTVARDRRRGAHIRDRR
jgi:hypothetical protein